MALTYFTLPELRALPDMDDQVRYTDARCTAVGEGVETSIERFVRTSFVARSATEKHDGNLANRRGWILLRQRHPITVTALTQNGVALTAPELTELNLEFRALRRRAGGSYTAWRTWEIGNNNIQVTYTAGYSSAPPGDIKQTALAWTRYRLLTSDSRAGNDGRATGITTDAGTLTLVVAGKDRPSGYPEVDAVLVDWRDRITAAPGIA